MNCTTDEIIEKTLDEIKERFQTNPKLHVVLKGTGEIRQRVDYNGNVFFFNYRRFMGDEGTRTPFEFKKMVKGVVTEMNEFLVRKFQTNSASGYLDIQEGTESITVIAKMPAPLEAKYRQMEIEYWKDVDETREALRAEYGRPEEYTYNPDEEEYNSNEEDDYGYQVIGQDPSLFTMEDERESALRYVVGTLKSIGVNVQLVNNPTFKGKWMVDKYGRYTFYISRTTATLDTPIHEFIEPFIKALQKSNPDVINNLINALERTQSGKRIIESVRKARPELSTEDLKIEIIAQAVGEYAALDIIAKKAYNKGVVSAIKNFFRAIATFLKKNLLPSITIADINENSKLEDIVKYIRDGRIRLPRDPKVAVQNIVDELSLNVGEDLLKNEFTYDEAVAIQQALQAKLYFFGTKQDRVAVFFSKVQGSDTFTISRMVNDPDGNNTSLSAKQMSLYAPIDEEEQLVDNALLENENILDEITGPDMIFDPEFDAIPGLTFSGQKNPLLNILFNFESLNVLHFIERLESLNTTITTREILNRLKFVDYNNGTTVVMKELSSTTRFSEYDPATNTIYINKAMVVDLGNAESFVDAIVHEVIHSKVAYILHKFNLGDINELTDEELDFCKKVKILYDQALNAARAIHGNNLEFEIESNPTLYGLQNIYEFVSEVLTNKQFHTFLESVENYKPATGAKGFIYRIINTVLDFLGMGFRLGESKTDSIFESFFNFQDSFSEQNDPSRYIFTSEAPFALDINRLKGGEYSEITLLNVLEKNLVVQIQQLEDLSRVSETEGEIEERAFYERELAQRKIILATLRELRESQNYTSAIEFFIRSNYDRIVLLYNDLNSISDEELTSPTTRNKLFLLKTYLKVINPINSQKIRIQAEITDYDRTEVREYEARKREKERAFINGSITADEFDTWIEDNPNPITVDLIYERLNGVENVSDPESGLVDKVERLLFEKIYPAMADWLANDFTDEDLQALDTEFREEVQSILASGYSEAKKLRLIKKARLESIRGTRELFIQQLSESMKATTEKNGLVNVVDIYGFPIINNNDVVLSLFSKKVKRKFDEARTKSMNTQEKLLKAFQELYGSKSFLSPEAFFDSFIDQGVYYSGDELVYRPKLVSEYDMDKYKLAETEFFRKIEKDRADKLDEIEDEVKRLSDPIQAMTIRSNRITDLENKIALEIKAWYKANTKEFDDTAKAEFVTFISDQRDRYTNLVNNYFAKILAEIDNGNFTNPTDIKRIVSEYADKFKTLREDRDTDYNADKLFLQWYGLEKLKLQNSTNPESRKLLEMLEKMRNYFDYQEKEYRTWFDSNVRYSEISGEVYPKGKSIIPADKYLNKKFAQLTDEEKAFLEVLHEQNRAWQNRLPVGERLPEDMLPVTRRDIGVASTVSDVVINTKKKNFLFATRELFKNVALTSWKGFIDTFKSVYSNSDYTNHIQRLKDTNSDFSQDLDATTQRQVFPIYYTNYKNRNISYSEIEKNPLVSLFNAHVMANNYNAKNDLFSEISLMDYVMQNRKVINNSDLRGFLNSGVIDTYIVDGEIKDEKVLDNKIRKGLLRFIWNHERSNLGGLQSRTTPKSIDEIVNSIDKEYKQTLNLSDINRGTTAVAATEKSVNKAWEYFKRNNLFLQNSQKAFGISGIVKPLIYWKSLVGLAGNLYSALRTINTGTLHNLISASSRQTFTKRDLFVAFFKATKDIALLFVHQNLGMYQSNRSARARYFLEKMDALQGEGIRRAGDRLDMQRRIIKMLNSPISTLGFGAQSYTEGFVALQTMYATARAIKVKTRNNKEISLLDAYTFDSTTGSYKVSPIVASTPEELEEFHRLETVVLDNHQKVMKENQGVYDSFNKIMLSESLLGQALLQFRKWVIPNINKRTQRFRIDVESKRMKKGYWRVVSDRIGRQGALKAALEVAYRGAGVTFLTKNTGIQQLPMFNFLNRIGIEKRSSPLEKSYLNSFVAENYIMYSLLGLTSIALTLAGVDDEDDDLDKDVPKWLAYLAYFSKSTRMEMETLDPITMFTTFATIPIGAQIEQFRKVFMLSVVFGIRFFKHVSKDDVDIIEAYDMASDDIRYQKSDKTDLIQRDENGKLPTKLEVSAKKLLPGKSNFDMILNPHAKYNALRQYDKSMYREFIDAITDEQYGRSSRGFKKSELQKEMEKEFSPDKNDFKPDTN